MLNDIFRHIITTILQYNRHLLTFDGHNHPPYLIRHIIIYIDTERTIDSQVKTIIHYPKRNIHLIFMILDAFTNKQ